MDFAHGGAEQGVHIANAGANWQIAVFGFAGMRTAMESDTFTLEPKLPAEWSRLSFPVRWKGKQLKINIDKSSVAITNLGEASVRIKVYETVATVLPGETETISWG
jgi:trehalose/maltose hydrolase-like predicted phosphorylase